MTIELGFTLPALNNSYATGSATLGVGALLFIPFALKFGRRPIYLFSLAGQLAVAVWAAKMKTTTDLFLTQAFNCLLGSLGEVLVQMTIADMFFVHERGLVTSIYVLVMSVGTQLAGLVAGYITVGQGWRWVWWWVAILIGTCLVLFTFLYEETKFIPRINGVSGVTFVPSTEDERKALDHKSSDNELIPVSSTPTAISPPRKSYLQRLKPIATSKGNFLQLAVHSIQPLLVVCTIPAVSYVALVYGLVTAALQVSVTLIAAVMPAPPYNFTPAQVGLMSLPPLIGNILGTAIGAPITDRLILYLARRNKGIYEPEMRLWLLLIFAPIFPAGIILFGYGLGLGMSWPVVAMGSGLMGFAMTPIASVALSYLTDAYTDVSFSLLLNVDIECADVWTDYCRLSCWNYVHT
jgi:MFS family permease